MLSRMKRLRNFLVYLLLEPAQDNQGKIYTLQNVYAIQDEKIWDFRRQSFVALDINNRRCSCCLLLQYAQKLLKVTHLTKHICIQDDIKEYLPLDLILRFFSIDR